MTDALITQKNSSRAVLLIAGLLLTLVMAILPVSQVYAQSKEQVCLALGQGYDAGSNTCTPPSGQQAANARVGSIIETALNLLSIVVGVAAVVMILLAGFRYITAGGDSNRISSAQDSIIWAIIGLVVTAMAQVIVRFVLTRI